MKATDKSSRTEPDDERTVIVPATSGVALPSGHALQEFVIDGVLGEGGFGIVYRAQDTRLRRRHKRLTTTWLSLEPPSLGLSNGRTNRACFS